MNKKPANTNSRSKEDKQYAKKLRRFNAFVKKNRYVLPEGVKFNREEAHERP